MGSRNRQYSFVFVWAHRRCQHKIRYTGNRCRTLLWIFVFNSRSRRHPRAAQSASLMETVTCQMCRATAVVRRILLCVAAVICSASAVRAADCSDPRSIAEFRGNGITNTRPFETDGPFELVWSSDKFVGITLEQPDRPGAFKTVRAVGSKGGGSAYLPMGGKFYLQIDGSDNWTISIRRINRE